MLWIEVFIDKDLVFFNKEDVNKEEIKFENIRINLEWVCL